jgi:hypothetical protein
MIVPEPISHVAPAKPAPQRFYGKYRGTVENNIDPLHIGRIVAVVPQVSGITPTGWALPCAPFPADGVASLTVPPIGASVWIEFEAGNPDNPIWSGGFWSFGHPPLLQIPD